MGSKTKIETPAAPQAPSQQESINAWISAMPQIYEMQRQYEPQLMEQQLQMQNKYATDLARQQFELQNQYGMQYAQMEKNLQEQLYPETSKLQEQLAKTAGQGMNSQAPDWYTSKYSDYYKSLLGDNVKSPIGADYYSTGMLEQQKGWNDYYQNLALSVSGRQPLVQGQQVGMAQYQPQLNWTQGFNPQASMGYAQQGYGTYAGLYGNMYNTNANMAQFNASKPYMAMNAAGNVLGGFGAMM